MSQGIPPTDPRVAGSEPHEPTDDKEEIYYDGTPLIRGEIGKFLLLWLLGLLFIAAPFLYYWFSRENTWPVWWLTVASILIGILIMWIPVIIMKSVRYRVSNYRIDFERGIFGKKIDTLELWHVDDIKMEQSFADRMLGVGTITVLSNDTSTPRLPLRGLPNPRPLFESLKQRVIAVKRQRGVVKMDMGGHAGPA
jgi:membrane protein YdbS with pleckstrin-like domain